MPSSLNSNDSPNLWPGQSLVSDNGRAIFKAQTDGNLVVYAHLSNDADGEHPLWESGSSGRSYNRVTMNGNGELCAFTYENNGADTTWKNGSWNSGRPGPYTLRMQDDGNLVIYAADGAAIWASGTHVSPEPIPFSQVTFVNGSNGALCAPLVKNYNGSKMLWNGDNTYWDLVQGVSKTVDFNTDTTKDNQTTIGQLIGDGTVVSLGLYVVWGDHDWVNPWTGYQFVYQSSSRQRLTFHKFGGLNNGDAAYDGAVTF
ncbi:Lectin [Pseudocercospora fuligena]|uniref:Lectin n=1 Tax=Pseudocercospora fuligena TaxID=685502 RepID=A0A8H6RMX3_9PEZI|nr:Lectin [Pseudocercospora fuligena]